MRNRSVIYQQVLTEYQEQPGLQLTVAQAACLWGLNRRRCATVLRALAAAGCLRYGRDGSYRDARVPPAVRTAGLGRDR